MFITDMEDALYQVVSSNLNIPVIFDYSNGPEPTVDCCVLGMTLLTKLNRDSKYFYSTPTGFEEQLKQDYEVMFTFRFYGDSCYDNAMKIQAILSMNTTQQNLHYYNDISVVDITQIRRIPELRETQYIQKASFDMNLLIGFDYIQDIDWFNTVSYEGDYKDSEGNIVLHESETVSANDNP